MYDYVIVGLGATGLSCARYLARKGCDIAVVDSRKQPPNSAILTAEYPNVAQFLGGFDAEVLQQAKTLVISPGVALATPAIQACADKGIPIVGDISLFVEQVKSPIIAITGTNGKSTVTDLVGEMVKAAGYSVAVLGNIGTPVLDSLQSVEPDFYVLELSSFQLETLEYLPCAVATILNISPDHLDRYFSQQDYILAKQRIYANTKLAVYNAQYTATRPNNPCKSISFTLSAPNQGEFGIVKQDEQMFIAFGPQLLMPVVKMKIKGVQNWANALAALALGRAVSLPTQQMLAVLQQYPGLPHRCEWIRNVHKVDWYNDSKGTNVGATVAAIQGLGAGMLGKIVLIAGGQAKGASFSELQASLKDYVREVVLIGEDSDKIEADLANIVPLKKANSMSEAVSTAKAIANPGDVVLLSPACASFDMFKNFGHRGDVFRKCVEDL